MNKIIIVTVFFIIQIHASDNSEYEMLKAHYELLNSTLKLAETLSDLKLKIPSINSETFYTWKAEKEGNRNLLFSIFLPIYGGTDDLAIHPTISFSINRFTIDASYKYGGIIGYLSDKYSQAEVTMNFSLDKKPIIKSVDVVDVTYFQGLKIPVLLRSAGNIRIGYMNLYVDAHANDFKYKDPTGTVFDYTGNYVYNDIRVKPIVHLIYIGISGYTTRITKGVIEEVKFKNGKFLTGESIKLKDFTYNYYLDVIYAAHLDLENVTYDGIHYSCSEGITSKWGARVGLNFLLGIYNYGVNLGYLPGIDHGYRFNFGISWGVGFSFY